MEHNRKLLIGAVSLVIGNVRNDHKALTTVRNEIESSLISLEWFPSAPFKYISLIIRYGNKTDLIPEFEPIRQKYGELPISIELEMEKIRTVDQDKDKMESMFRQAILEALLKVAEKYNLPKFAIEASKS